MNYKLAKELRDKGFPQNHIWIDGKHTVHCAKCASDKTLNEPYEACRPTLSELIEACGERFGILQRTEDGQYLAWAGPELKNKGGGQIILNASTPQEAVASLYLALHQ